MKHAITILIAALGGEGGGVLAEWLVETAIAAGHPAQSTSIPGVAQRTGATTYYIEIHPDPASALAGRAPVLSLLPVPGCIDLLVASELLECARTVLNGMPSEDRTTLVTSTSRALTTAEKMVPGDGRFDPAALLAVARENSRRLIALDMEALAQDGAVSAVMFGAIAASGMLPFSRAQCEQAIRGSGVGVETSLAGFARAWDAVRAPGVGAAAPAESRAAPPASPAVAGRFPEAIAGIVEAGFRRLADYQDAAYAGLYLERLDRILAVERRWGGADGWALTRETARFLALWMAFEDVVRVADLKCRASRFARVRRELRAGEGDLVRIFDHFKPGIAELCALLPAPLAQPLAAWDARRQARGKAPLALALRLRSDGIAGFLALRALAGLRRLRPGGARYRQEQALIESWLGAIEDAGREHWQTAFEIALCGRLVKGYGATNARAKANLAHILAELARGGSFPAPERRADAIRLAREAALADEGGVALDAVLVRQGASRRPLQPQPIRWVRRQAPARTAPPAP